MVVVVVAMLLAAPSAQAAPPELDYVCTPAPGDCSGWYRSDVQPGLGLGHIHRRPGGGGLHAAGVQR